MLRLLLSLIYLPCLLGISACDTPPLRTGVPLWAGLTVTDSCDLVPLVLQDAPSSRVSWKGYVFEIPLEVTRTGEPSDFRFYRPHTLDTLVAVLNRQQKPYLLHFELQNPHELDLGSLLPAPYFMTLSGMLLRTMTHPPAGIIFGGSLTDPAFAPGSLSAFCQEIHQALPGFKGDIIFAAPPSHLLSPDFDWETPDALGVLYPQAPPGQRPDYRRFNQALSLRAGQVHKPVFIAQTNLSASPKLPAFRRQLTHWDGEVLLTGAVLNHLFCAWPKSGSDPFYSFYQDGTFLRFLRQYAGGGGEK
jgi:hypothetical protein